MNVVCHALRCARRRAWQRAVSLTLVLTAAWTVGLAPAGSADTVGDKKRLDADIARLRNALEDTSRDLAQAFVELHRTRAELPAARRALAAAAAAQVRADRHMHDVAMALAIAEANEVKATNTLARNTRESRAVEDQLGNLARDDYQQGAVSGLSIALEASSPEELTNRIVWMDTVMRVRDATLRELDTMRAEGTAVRAHLVAVRQQVAAFSVQAQDALAQATRARQAAATAKTRLDLLYAAQARFAARVTAKKATETKNLNRMQARSDALAGELAARARAARVRAAREVAARQAAARAANLPVPVSPPPKSGSGILRPAVNAPVSSEFGWRVHPIWRTRRLHAGIDFAARCGSPVYAAASGVVILVAPVSVTGGYGNQLVIDHGLVGHGVDLTTTYNHLSRFVVTGGHVSAGQIVAYSGTTGTSTGCHLHFETRVDGVPVNPRRWL